jgi:hypothetical protein
LLPLWLLIPFSLFLYPLSIPFLLLENFELRFTLDQISNNPIARATLAESTQRLETLLTNPNEKEKLNLSDNIACAFYTKQPEIIALYQKHGADIHVAYNNLSDQARSDLLEKSHTFNCVKLFSSLLLKRYPISESLVKAQNIALDCLSKTLKIIQMIRSDSSNTSASRKSS